MPRSDSSRRARAGARNRGIAPATRRVRPRDWSRAAHPSPPRRTRRIGHRRPRGRSRRRRRPDTPPETPGRRFPHIGGDVVVGQGPYAHRPLERPLLSSHHCSHHVSEALAGLDVCRVLEPLAILILQAAPGLEKCGAVSVQVGEVPIEAALGDTESLAQPVDAQCIRSTVGEEGEAGLDPVVHRKPACGTARRGHAGQHTTTSNFSRAKFSDGNEFRQEGAVATVAAGSHRRSSASTSSPPGRRHPSVPIRDHGCFSC